MTENINETFLELQEQINLLKQTVDKLQSIIDSGIKIKARDGLIVAEFNELSKDG